VAWRGVAWRGVVWLGEARRGAERPRVQIGASESRLRRAGQVPRVGPIGRTMSSPAELSRDSAAAVAARASPRERLARSQAAQSGRDARSQWLATSRSVKFFVSKGGTCRRIASPSEPRAQR